MAFLLHMFPGVQFSFKIAEMDRKKNYRSSPTQFSTSQKVFQHANEPGWDFDQLLLVSAECGDVRCEGFKSCVSEVCASDHPQRHCAS